MRGERKELSVCLSNLDIRCVSIYSMNEASVSMVVCSKEIESQDPKSIWGQEVYNTEFLYPTVNTIVGTLGLEKVS